jgi:hypothetical protein
MPEQIRAGSPQSNRVDPSMLQKAAATGKAMLSSMAAATKSLAFQLKGAASNNFHKLTGCFCQKSAGVLVQNLKKGRDDNTLVLKKIDPSGAASVTKQMQANRAIDFLERLKPIADSSKWTSEGHVNLSLIEHFCGFRSKADARNPDFQLRSDEGKTLLLAPYRDFMLNVIDAEVGLLDSMLDDVARSNSDTGLNPQIRDSIIKLSAVIRDCGSTMSMISRNQLLEVQKNDPWALGGAADACLEKVKSLPAGEKMIIPLAFLSYGRSRSQHSGHATYMVVEKNHDYTVNMHMVNRGAGSGRHRPRPNQEPVAGKPLKRDSAVSKWNVPVDQLGGFSHNFMMKTLRLTLDVEIGADNCMKTTSNDDHKAKMLSNIEQFYREFGARTGGDRPADRPPIYQRGQKDGNCAYSNLKASMRYILDDSKAYNQIDRAKIEKLSALTLGYAKGKLLKDFDPSTGPLNRLSFDLKGAAKILVSKHEKVTHRIKMDNGYAMPINLPPNVRNVTN